MVWVEQIISVYIYIYMYIYILMINLLEFVKLLMTLKIITHLHKRQADSYATYDVDVVGHPSSQLWQAALQ